MRKHIFDNTEYANGDVAAGIAVSVWTDATATTLATLYAAATGATTLSNPLVSDAKGYIECWVEDGQVYGTTLGDSTPRPLHVIGGDLLSVKDYGAVGDGVADDTAAIQAAIDACHAEGGGIVSFPPGEYGLSAPLVARDNVKLVGSGYQSVYDVTYKPPVRLVGDDGFALISGGTDPIYDFGVDGIGLIGVDVAGSRGISALNAWNWTLRNLFCSEFGEHGVYIESGVAGSFEDVWVQECHKQRTAATYVGAFQLGDASHIVTDVFARNVVASCGFPATAGGYLSGYHCGILAAGSTSTFVMCVGHMSETGIKTLASASDYATFIGCRADLNQGHGVWVSGGAQTFIGCLALNNSRDTDATYSGFNITYGCNTFIGCRIDNVAATPSHLYGFLDVASGGVGNVFSGNFTSALTTGGLYKVDGTGTTSPPIIDGHLGTTPVAVTGDRSDGVALTNLLTVLDGLGLIDDQTVA
jgi:hypothetical protein